MRLSSRSFLEVPLKKLALVFALSMLPFAANALVTVEPSVAAPAASKLGDLSSMRSVVADTLTLVNANNTRSAIKRITEFETAWDKNAKRLKKLDPKAWKKLDEASDVALSTVRYPSATAEEMKKDLSDLIAALDNPG